MKQHTVLWAGVYGNTIYDHGKLLRQGLRQVQRRTAGLVIEVIVSDTRRSLDLAGPACRP